MTTSTEGGGGGAQPAPPIPYAENLFATEVYADESTYFAIKGGNVSITFCSAVWDNSGGPGGQLTRVVVGRLVMPIHGAQGLALGLYDFLAQRGHAPPITSSGDAKPS